MVVATSGVDAVGGEGAGPDTPPSPTRSTTGAARAARALAFPVAVWGVWRVAHWLAIVAFGGDPVGSAFHSDGTWFLSVLRDGYVVTDPSYATEQNTAFMPGVALLAWPLARLVGARTAALAVANATGLAAFCAVHGATLSWSPRRTARIATLALALWPTSFFLWSYYSEGLFIAATGLALWAETRDRPLPAYVGCFLAPLARTVGIALGPVLAVARWRRLGRIDAVAVGYLASGLAAPAVVSAVQRRRTGDALAWVHAQQAWGRAVSPPWTPIVTAISDVVAKRPQIALELSLNLVAIAVAGVGAAVLVRRWWRHGLPLVVAAWTVTAMVLPLCSVVVSSQVRFALGAWPALAAFGGDGRGARALRITGAALGVTLSLALLRRWAQDARVA